MLSKEGAPYGNQNARKHGFYSRILNKDQRRLLQEASTIKGLDNEIAILRVKFASLAQQTGNEHLLAEVSTSLARLLHTRENLASTHNDDLGVAIKKIIRDIGVPLGVKVNPEKLSDP